MKKLTDEKQAALLEAGIAAFARAGFRGASIGAIAGAAGTSVGVLYKYYENKEAFFDACLRHSLRSLEALLDQVTAEEGKLLDSARQLIRGLQAFSRTHPDHVRLYHRITASQGAAAVRLAGAIESVTARLYTDWITRAQAEGAVRGDMDPRLFALFFDNLLMMTQFTGCCDYYRARLAFYRDPPPSDETMEEELLKFLESAFTLEQAAISHREEERK